MDADWKSNLRPSVFIRGKNNPHTHDKLGYDCRRHPRWPPEHHRCSPSRFPIMIYSVIKKELALLPMLFAMLLALCTSVYAQQPAPSPQASPQASPAASPQASPAETGETRPLYGLQGVL